MLALGDLHHVVPLARTAQSRGLTITLLSLEVYDGGSVLSMRLTSDQPVPLAELRGPRGPEPDTRVRADGREFVARLHEASGSAHEWRFRYVLTPPLEDNSETLEVDVPEIALRLVTPQGIEKLETWRGPWSLRAPLR